MIMKKELAIDMVEAISSFNDPIDVLVRLCNKIDDEEERQRFRKHIGDVMYILAMELLNSIVAQYPELEPDENLRERNS